MTYRITSDAICPCGYGGKILRLLAEHQWLFKDVTSLNSMPAMQPTQCNMSNAICIVDVWITARNQYYNLGCQCQVEPWPGSDNCIRLLRTSGSPENQGDPLPEKRKQHTPVQALLLIWFEHGSCLLRVDNKPTVGRYRSRHRRDAIQAGTLVLDS